MEINELRKLCALYWNPIGIPMANLDENQTSERMPLPADEYDTYLEHLNSMIQRGATRAELFDYLTLVEREYIMLSEPSGDKNAFIVAVLATKKE